MDPLTQGTIGAVLPQALSKKNLGIVALLGFLSGMAPDLDILIRSNTDPLLSPINSSIQSKLWLKEKYSNYKHQNMTLAHAPRPYKKSLLLKIEEEAIGLFNKVRSTNFRSWKTPAVLVDFVPRWLEHHRYAKITKTDSLYIESGSYEIKIELELLRQKFGKISFFCINDTCDDADDMDKRLQLVREEMEILLPNKSSFEI